MYGGHKHCRCGAKSTTNNRKARIAESIDRLGFDSFARKTTVASDGYRKLLVIIFLRKPLCKGTHDDIHGFVGELNRLVGFTFEGYTSDVGSAFKFQ